MSQWAPPGHFLCCICFDMPLVDDAWRDKSGQAWDLCRECGDLEEYVRVNMKRNNRHGYVNEVPHDADPA